MTRGEQLFAWYREHRRDLPWRHTTDPYRILVSEVMLQQTQVTRVVGAYHRFMERFPTEADLAAAPLAAVLAEWQGLGYPVRARRLREAARIVVDVGWPTDATGLQRLPGVGPYTAAAVTSFAFGERIAAVDTNVRRVLSRWRGQPLAGADLAGAANGEMTGDAATWNQAVMELGALVCRPRNPACGECPVAADCADPNVYSPPPRQARYEGSTRQVRGDILRALGSGPMPVVEVADRVRAPADTLGAALDGLAADGLVTLRGATVAIGS